MSLLRWPPQPMWWVDLPCATVETTEAGLLARPVGRMRARTAPRAPSETSLLFCRSLGKIDRLVGELVQIVDDVGALGVARQARESHGRARHIALGVGQELVELVEGPVAALALQRGRVVETGSGRFRPAHDVPEVGAHLVGTALLEAVAGDAGLGGRFAALGARTREQHLDRLGSGRGRGAMVAGRRVLLHRDLVAPLGLLPRRGDGPRRRIGPRDCPAG